MRVLQRQQRWIDYTGLNLIRIVIGSYFMAISLGLISGIAPPVLFLSFTDPTTADLIGTILLFSITALFMVGVYLRLTSLMLAIFVFSSSIAQNFVLTDATLIEPFWRDLTLVCAILLSYTCLKRTELSRAALVWRRTTPRLKSSQTVMPRRVTSNTTGSERGAFAASYNASLKPLMQRNTPSVTAVPDSTRPQPLAPDTPQTPPARPKLVAERIPESSEAEVENIFAAL